MAQVLAAHLSRTAVGVDFRRVVEICLWLLLILLLLIHVPAFLCMGLNTDASQWDLCARTVSQGGVAYRDAVENNLPGMLWLHVLVRHFLGWRPEALRLADLLVVAAIVWRLTVWLPSSATRGERLGLALACLAFYFSTSEWSHCQRDLWMLLPALLALELRRRQVRLLAEVEPSLRVILGMGFVEGAAWGAAFWIKPYVAVPMLAAWLLSVWLAWRAPGRARQRLLPDTVALLAGGLAAGGAGCAWLIASGAWPSFAEILFVWNREYVRYNLTGEIGWLERTPWWQRFFPWMLVHVAAVAEALGLLWQAARAPRGTAGRAGRSLVATLYLGWLLQAWFLQHRFDYVLVPTILLGGTVIAGRFVTAGDWLTKGLISAVVILCVLLTLPHHHRTCLAHWARCVREGSTAELRDRLTLGPQRTWCDLEHVMDFLRGEMIQDGELSCIQMGPMSLYEDLGIRPATRFHFLYKPLKVFRQRRETIYAELSASRQRFVVVDLAGEGMEGSPLLDALEEGESRKDAPPGGSASEPWLERLAYRAGRYVVFRVSGPQMRGWLDAIFQEGES
jgi:hypothetical protein